MTADATVYVVDDDPDVLKSLAELVTSIKLPVRCYPSATEFLDDYDPALPGCLVVDVRMPVMSGIELQEQIRRLGSDIPVIMLTGHGDVPMAVRALKCGAVDFLEKPCRAQTLIDRIQHSLQIDVTGLITHNGAGCAEAAVQGHGQMLVSGAQTQGDASA